MPTCEAHEDLNESNSYFPAYFDYLVRRQSQIFGELHAIPLHCRVNAFNKPRKPFMSFAGDYCFMSHVISYVRKIYVASERF